MKQTQANESNNYIVTLIEDGDDLILPLPDRLLEEAGWNDGDILDIVNDRGINMATLNRKKGILKGSYIVDFTTTLENLPINLEKPNYNIFVYHGCL